MSKIKWYQLYKGNLPTKRINTVKGEIDYADFLFREKIRLEKLGRCVKIEGGNERKNGRAYDIKLFVNKVA